MGLGMKAAVLALVPLLLLPAGNAGPAAVEVHVEAALKGPEWVLGESGSDQIYYDHYDCVGPGLPDTPVTPGTPGPHATHTDTVTITGPFTGLIVSKQSLELHGDGVCHINESGPVLEYEFTGTHRVTTVCAAGTTNPGTVQVDWTTEHVAGVVTSESWNSAPCFIPVGSPSYNVEVTIEIDFVNLVFWRLANGGIRYLTWR